ncbi:MAG: 6-carboxytetrahydropterin synthase QueD [Nitrospinae bacterium]|nr:6-carboxytetrahydropterin synthase QueD [Nitrospinota bacterium]
MGYELSIRASFAAAHQLNGYEGVCENLHGHNWKAEVFVTTDKLNDIGIALDFKILKSRTEDILSVLDHKNLNQIPPFQEINPSSENIARWLYQKLSEALKGYDVKVSKVCVWETDKYCAAYSESL